MDDSPPNCFFYEVNIKVALQLPGEDMGIKGDLCSFPISQHTSSQL